MHTLPSEAKALQILNTASEFYARWCDREDICASIGVKDIMSSEKMSEGLAIIAKTNCAVSLGIFGAYDSCKFSTCALKRERFF